MLQLTWTVLITPGIWCVMSIGYLSYWVSSILAEPDLPVYERNGLLPALGFAVYRLPYLLIALLVVIVLELVIVPWAVRKPGSMV